MFFVSVVGHSANDNRERLPNAFASAGWEVACIGHESLEMNTRILKGRDSNGHHIEINGWDRYFILGFGAAATFLERMQMLATLDEDRFVNTPTSLSLQHGKPSLYLNCPEVKQPESYLINDPAALVALVESGGNWIAKPPAGSFGNNVYSLNSADTNLRAILEHLSRDGQYVLLQRYVRGQSEEKRVLVAGGKVIGAYGKSLADHRGNLSANSIPHCTKLTCHEIHLVENMAKRLIHFGVRFLTADIISPYVLEVNVANPGWLQTWESITGIDLSPNVVAALSNSSSTVEN